MKQCSSGGITRAALKISFFAYDTLVIGSSGPHVGQYVEAIGSGGREYGLDIHWGKVPLLTVCTELILKSFTGRSLQKTTSMVYFGSAAHSDVKYAAEFLAESGQQLLISTF